LIPDIEQFLLVAIFKMATTISQKFNIVQYHAILKMASGRNCSISGINSGHHYLPTYQFSMSGINSGHHYLPTYQIVMISDNVEFLWYILFSKWPSQYRKNSTLTDIITIWYVGR
jgi:hypothetical protein